MITTSTSPFVLESGSERQFDGSSIICEPVFFELRDAFSVRLRVLDSATTSDIAQAYIGVTVAEVDAETGSGSGETAPWFNALQKAIITKLSSYSGNGSTVFTIV